MDHVTRAAQTWRTTTISSNSSAVFEQAMNKPAPSWCIATSPPFESPSAASPTDPPVAPLSWNTRWTFASRCSATSSCVQPTDSSSSTGPEQLDLAAWPRWARNRVTNHALREQAARRDQRRVSPTAASEADLVDPAADPTDAFDDRDLLDAVQERLSDQERVLAERWASGDPWAEIGARIGVAPGRPFAFGFLLLSARREENGCASSTRSADAEVRRLITF